MPEEANMYINEDFRRDAKKVVPVALKRYCMPIIGSAALVTSFIWGMEWLAADNKSDLMSFGSAFHSIFITSMMVWYLFWVLRAMSWAPSISKRNDLTWSDFIRWGSPGWGPVVALFVAPLVMSYTWVAMVEPSPTPTSFSDPRVQNMALVLMTAYVVYKAVGGVIKMNRAYAY